MNFDKRLLIEENISKPDISYKEVCEFTGIPRSTIIREINTYSVFVVGDNDFDTSKCKRFSKFPFVCNGCQSYFVCRRQRLKYSAKKSELVSEKISSRARQILHKDKDLLISLMKNYFNWLRLMVRVFTIIV